MTKERPEPPEHFVSKEELVRVFAEKGLQDPEAQELLQLWAAQNEAASLGHGPEVAGRANIEAAVRQALVYHEAGYTAEALDELETIKEAAQFQDEQLYWDIVGLIERLQLPEGDTN